MLNVVDKFTHECLAIRVSRKLKGIDVIAMSCLACSCCAAFPVADSDEVARAFRDDAARYSDMMSPRAGSLAGG